MGQRAVYYEGQGHFVVKKKKKQYHRSSSLNDWFIDQ